MVDYYKKLPGFIVISNTSIMVHNHASVLTAHHWGLKHDLMFKSLLIWMEEMCCTSNFDDNQFGMGFSWK